MGSLIGRVYIVSLKTLGQKNPKGQKPNKREKEYNAQNVYIAPPEMNNFILITCYTDTYVNQNLYTNLVNNFARFGVNVYVSTT